MVLPPLLTDVWLAVPLAQGVTFGIAWAEKSRADRRETHVPGVRE